MKVPICSECKEGEIMQMSLKKNKYHNGVWYSNGDSKDDLEIWYRCENCMAEFLEEEINDLLVDTNSGAKAPH